MWKDFKYLIAYVAPLAAYLGLYFQGPWSFGSIYVGFVLIPFLELFLPYSAANQGVGAEKERLSMRYFDWLLYLNIPILYGLIAYYLLVITSPELLAYERWGMTLSVGLIVGTIGINVAHELGHRQNQLEQRLSKLLLLSGMYMHFFIEHNRGHHKHVGTPADPATARFGESIYVFWLRSVFGSYLNAWKLEAKRLRQLNHPVVSWRNEMLRFQLAQLAYLLGIGLLVSWAAIPYALGIAVVGFLMLESVNYIEHYGLQRRQLKSGRYEPVGPQHSWNSDHELGRIFLYELTRHSDHHYKATRKYQVLRHWDDSPQLPMGYPGAILLSLVPPLWFSLMNSKVQAWNAEKKLLVTQ